MATTIRLTPPVINSFSAEVVEGVRLVGEIVTHSDRQWWVHSIEGQSWFAFREGNVISADLFPTPSTYIREPEALIIPMGHKVGQGLGEIVPMGKLTRGVCLAKAYV